MNKSCNWNLGNLSDFCLIDFLCNQNCSIFTVQSFFVQSTWKQNFISETKWVSFGISSLDRQWTNLCIVGMVNREGESDMSATRLESLAAVQVRLLRHALSFPRVKKVVYSTCSTSTEENEEVIGAVLGEKDAAFEAQSGCLPSWPRRGLDLETTANGDCFLRADPELDLCNGFFVAVLKRKRCGQKKGRDKPEEGKNCGHPRKRRRKLKKRTWIKGIRKLNYTFLRDVVTVCYPEGKKSELNFDFIEYFQPLLPKNTLYTNKIIMYHHFKPLSPANLKWVRFGFLHFKLLH